MLFVVVVVVVKCNIRSTERRGYSTAGNRIRNTKRETFGN